MQQLSAQDPSFVYLESPATPMHVGSLRIYDGSAVDPDRLTDEAVTRMVDERLHLTAGGSERNPRAPDADTGTAAVANAKPYDAQPQEKTS